jgi:hypothetical protein
MFLHALWNTVQDLSDALALIGVVLLAIGVLSWHSKREKRRAEERCKVEVEIVTPAFLWPPKPRPAVAETRRRAV